MKNLFLIPIAACLLMVVACSKQQQASFTVSGTMPDSTYDGKMIYLVDRNLGKAIDSMVIQDSRFTFQGKVDTATFALAQSGKLRFQFILENGTITLDPENPMHPQGTPLNAIFNRLIQAEDSLDAILYEKRQQIHGLELSEEEASRQNKEFYENEWEPAYQRKMSEFFTQNQTNDIGTIAFQRLSYVLDENQMDSVLSLTSDFLKSREMIKKTAKRINALKTTKEGMPFVNFSIEQEDGSKLSLSDYVGKGKYTLVDFWASWCGPCRGEIPVIAEVYNQYKDKGLEVVSIGVWEAPADTRKGIAELNMTWPQIVNAQDIPASLYGFNGIPHIILFGPDGTIVARDLRGEAMKAKLKEVLK